MLHETAKDSRAYTETVHADVFTLADACRAAALAFVNDSGHWGPAELVAWLRGRETPGLSLLCEMDAANIGGVLMDARVEVRNRLETMLEAEGAARFAVALLSTGIVIHREDAHEGPESAPTRASQYLVDRVLALFASDYLARPEDYELELHVCSLCKTVEFDVEGRVHAVCGRHCSPEESAFGIASLPPPHVVPGRYATLPFAPKVAA